jgi:hypothetical protein
MSETETTSENSGEGRAAGTYPKWGGAPHTSEEARPTGFRYVEGVKAIRVTGGTYRNCEAIDGVFEVVNEPKDHKKLGTRVEVRCGWFGEKPRTCYPKLEVDRSRIEVIENYTGEVIDNIGDSSLRSRRAKSSA